MHVLIAQVRFTRALKDEEARRALTEAANHYEEAGGFHALYSVRITEREVINISYWSSREHAERGFAAARSSVDSLIGTIIDGRPDVRSGDLMFERRTAELAPP